MFSIHLRLAGAVTALGLLASLFLQPAMAQEQPICGPEVKHEVAKILEQSGYHKNPYSKQSLALKKELFEKFSYCADDSYPTNPNYPDGNDKPAYCGTLSFVASTAYERMRCCGYDPQKKQFACPVEILLPNGFGAPHFPGSYEYVLNCVDFGGGFVPVAADRVHLADEIYGEKPIWHFAVIADARERLKAQPLQGQTLRARSLLSWNTAPSGCYDNQIVWGNALDYKIRLDP